MTSVEPSWRVKTRPCPFYPLGRCIFADSCNFLHVDPHPVTAEPVSLKPSENTSIPATPPTLNINVVSPKSVRSPPRSPRTTSLLYALRDVIGDPDDEEQEDSGIVSVNISQTQPQDWSESLPTLVNKTEFERYTQAEADEDVSTHPTEQETEAYYDEAEQGSWTAISVYDDDNDDQFDSETLPENEGHSVEANVLEDETRSSPSSTLDDDVNEHRIVESNSKEGNNDGNVASQSAPSEPSTPSTPVPSSGLLSPIELSGLTLAPLFQINEDIPAVNVPESWRPPIPLTTTPPRSPSVSSTFDLLSSPFGSHSARALSPRLGPFIGRSPISPAKSNFSLTPNEGDTLSLDSPSEYHASRQAALEVAIVNVSNSATGQPELVDDSDSEDDEREDNVSDEDAEEIEANELERHSTNSEDGEEEQEPINYNDMEEEHDSYGHTSIWDADAEDNPTAVFVGNNSSSINDEVSDALRRSTETPTEFLDSNEAQFEDTEISTSSNFLSQNNSLALEEQISSSPLLSGGVHSNEPTDDGEDEETAFLAYLKSPSAQQNEDNNDTINSLYDIYSDIDSDSVFSPPPSNAPPLAGTSALPSRTSAPSNSSTPNSSLRERVFTPPAVSRKKSGTNAADSPTSLSSPITSLDSISRGRASPFSNRDIKSPSRGSGSQSPAQEVEVSRTIPFGFRSSFTLGRASRSSLMTNRNGNRSIPPSPLDTHSEIPDRSVPRSLSSSAGITPTSAPPKGLKPLRLSTVLDLKKSSRSTIHSRTSSFVRPVNNSQQSGNTNQSSPSSSPSVSSSHLQSDNLLLSSARSSLLPLHIRNSILSSNDRPGSPLSPRLLRDLGHLHDLHEPQSAPAASWQQPINYSRPSSRLSEPVFNEEDEDETFTRNDNDTYGETIRRPVSAAENTVIARSTRPISTYPPVYAIDTPKPTLMFAIASDDVEQVRNVLKNGDVSPNECVGPQSALSFALTNDKLANKLEIVKTLLAFGADPSVAKESKAPESSNPLPSSEKSRSQDHKNDSSRSTEGSDSSRRSRSLLEDLDPATKYYLERADAIHTRRMSVLIQRSFFRPLTRVRYELIGQDRVLEQLFRVLSMHSRELAVTPMVVMLCGPSGHGKSLLARKFGSLLDVPTHTVNMTTLRSTHDLWQSYSMSPYEEPTNCTLAEFLINNEGKRCVVVLDEIEKVVDQNTLWSLLMPWELGRCSFEAGSRHVDVKNVIWLGTSNIGHDLVFQHSSSRKNPDEPMSREEYVALMGLLRPKVSERLGTSLMSRITTVLPFVPFSLEEKKAICSEALYTLGGDFSRSLSSERVEALIDSALASYCSDEGARSLSRAISSQLVDII